ncbi:NifB/NifX family molybdenum-iron cluster-binding protein [Megalodesulfovibrio paquesii]
MSRLLIPLYGPEVAPRFDLATEVWIGELDPKSPERIRTSTIIVLPQASAEDLCQLILKEEVEVVLCGGIEEEFYDYLQWKKIKVIDSIVALAEDAAKAWGRGELGPGTSDERLLLPRSRA